MIGQRDTDWAARNLCFGCEQERVLLMSAASCLDAVSRQLRPCPLFLWEYSFWTLKLMSGIRLVARLRASGAVPPLPASLHYALLNLLTPNDPYMGRTAPLTFKCCILYIYSTNIGTEYFKHALYSPFFFSLQNAVCFIMLTCLVPVLFTFYIQGVLN